jgi:DNA-binding winged helix-turn-helix (wHTH) protein/tetratricopeptide (TPR) repeat protein
MPQKFSKNPKSRPVASTTSSYRFGSFFLNAADHVLLFNNAPIHMDPKAFHLLLYLVENSGRTVAKAELMDAVWPESFVEEANLSVQVAALRKALGAASGDTAFIKTIPRVGYRFEKTVEEVRTGIRSIAVLPLTMSCTTEEDEYLGVGIADTLISLLSHVPQLTVRSASILSRFDPRKEDPLQIGLSLGVDSILTGRIKRSGSNLGVTIELHDVAKRSLLWIQSFETTLTGIIGSIADRILFGLTAHLGFSMEKGESEPHFSRDSQAFQLYLKGRFHWSKSTGKDLEDAVSCFDRAVTIDPDFAEAYVGLAECYVLHESRGISPSEETMPKAREAARKAISIDESLAEAHASLAMVHLLYDWNWASAEEEFKRGLALRPDYASIHLWYGWYLSAMQRHKEALEEARRAQELDPGSLFTNTLAGAIHYLARQYDNALAILRSTIEMDADFKLAHYWLGQVYARRGLVNDAISEFGIGIKLMGGSYDQIVSLTSLDPKSAEVQANKICNEMKRLRSEAYVPAYEIATLYAFLKQVDEAFHWLETAFAERSSRLVLLNCSPSLDSLRQDPRFPALRQRVGLPIPSEGKMSTVEESPRKFELNG